MTDPGDTTSASPVRSPAGVLAGMRVLIAEDTWHTATVTRQTVERAGGTVVGVASTLAEAERMTEPERLAVTGCSCVVMDLNLNGQLGHELAGRLARQGMKVVVVSGYTRPDDLDPQIHAFLEKPSRAEKLILALAEPRVAPVG